MRMIVDAFKETLELGLEKHKQVVVRRFLDPSIFTTGNHCAGEWGSQLICVVSPFGEVAKQVTFVPSSLGRQMQ